MKYQSSRNHSGFELKAIEIQHYPANIVIKLGLYRMVFDNS